MFITYFSLGESVVLGCPGVSVTRRDLHRDDTVSTMTETSSPSTDTYGYCLDDGESRRASERGEFGERLRRSDACN